MSVWSFYLLEAYSLIDFLRKGSWEEYFRSFYISTVLSLFLFLTPLFQLRAIHCHCPFVVHQWYSKLAIQYGYLCICHLLYRSKVSIRAMPSPPSSPLGDRNLSGLYYNRSSEPEFSET